MWIEESFPFINSATSTLKLAFGQQLNPEKIDSPFSIVFHSWKTKSVKFISTCFSPFVPSTISKKGEKHELGIDSRKENFPVVEGEYEPVDTLLVQKGKSTHAISDSYPCHREDKKTKGSFFQLLTSTIPFRKRISNFFPEKSSWVVRALGAIR